MAKRVLIIGATGQVGSVITNYLLKELGSEFEIVGCSRSGGEALHLIKFDVFNDDWKTLGQFDYLVNCLGIIEETKTLTFEKVHIQNVKNILANRAQLGNPKIIQISALGASKDSLANYTKTKALGDELLSNTDNYMIFRPSFVCTPNTAIVQKINLIKTMAKWQLWFMPFPAHFLKSLFQPVLGEDLAEGVKQAIITEEKNRIINCTGPEYYTLKDWVLIASKNKVKFLPIPKKIIDLPFRLIISIFPSIMNKDQYLLLGSDNIADKSDFESFLGRKTQSTKAYWEKELLP